MDTNTPIKPGESDPEFEVLPDHEENVPRVEHRKEEVTDVVLQQADQSKDEEDVIDDIDETDEAPDEIPDEEADGFDPNIKIMMRDSLSKRTKADYEVDSKENSRSYSNLTEEEKEKYDIINKDSVDMVKKPHNCENSLHQSQINQTDENGEQILRKLQAFLVFPAGNKSVAADVIITDRSFTVSIPDSHDTDPSAHFKKDYSLAVLIEERREVSYLHIPLGLIEAVETIEFDSFDKVIMVKTKDFRTVAISLFSTELQETVAKELRKLAFPLDLDDDMYLMNFQYVPGGYFHKSKSSPAKLEKKALLEDVSIQSQMSPEFIDELLKNSEIKENGWEVYDFDEEFKRQGVVTEDSKFRVSEVWTTKKNSSSTSLSRQICILKNMKEKDKDEYFHTYAKKVYVPQSISEEDLAQCALFRSRQRFPALSYYNKD